MTVSEVLEGMTHKELEAGGRPFCTDHMPPWDLERMSGKVVVTGEVDRSDVHNSVVGEMAGYLMQANFIEAFLDDRYYRSMPALDFVYGFIFLAALELILIVGKDDWAAMALLIVVLAAVMLGLLWLTLRLAH